MNVVYNLSCTWGWLQVRQILLIKRRTLFAMSTLAMIWLCLDRLWLINSCPPPTSQFSSLDNGIRSIPRLLVVSNLFLLLVVQRCLHFLVSNFIPQVSFHWYKFHKSCCSTFRSKWPRITQLYFASSAQRGNEVSGDSSDSMLLIQIRIK